MLTCHSMKISTCFKQILNKGLLLIILASFMPAAHLVAQSKKVSGTVRDDKGAPLSGASVMISGSAKGTTTDGTGQHVWS